MNRQYEYEHNRQKENPLQLKPRPGSPASPYRHTGPSSLMRHYSQIGNQAAQRLHNPDGIPEPVKTQMEHAFKTDFSDVSITSNSARASRLEAIAYTRGNEIHFSPGMYNPRSGQGQEVLKHELAHVVQQRQGRVSPNARVNGVPINDNAALENEADNMAPGAAHSHRSYHRLPTAGISSGNNVVQCLKFTYTKGRPGKRGAKDIDHELTDEFSIMEFLGNFTDQQEFDKGKEEVEKSGDDELVKDWNNAIRAFGMSGIIRIAKDVDKSVFGSIENLATGTGFPHSPFKKDRHALDFISYVIETTDSHNAQQLHTLLFGNKPRENALTEKVRPGAKHEHLMTSKVVQRLLADLDDTRKGTNTQAYSYDQISKMANYTAWNLLDETLSDTYQIVLNTTTNKPGEGETQDHHVTSDDRIAYYPGGDLANPKQATGKGAGTADYHNDLKTVAETKGLHPKALAINLRKVNDDWLAEKNDITKVPAGKRAVQHYKVGTTMKQFNNAADLNVIAQTVENERKDVLDKFDMVIHKLK